MKRIIYGLCLVIMTLVVCTAKAGAEEAKSSTLTLDDIKQWLGVSVYIQGGYLYNLRDPDSGENDLRLFDHKSNSFSLDLAELMFNRDAPVGGIGYRLKLSAGETAKFIHSLGLGVRQDQLDDPGHKTEPLDLTEADIDYVAPLGKGIKFRFGKFVTYHGAEVIEAKDNPNYSRSFLFNYAVPFTHTGLMVGYSFSDAVSANVHIVNGWDNTIDNNKSKTVGLNLNVTPIEQIALAFNFMYGPEQSDNNSNNRLLFDWVGTIKPFKDFTLILNTDYATEEKVAPDGSDATWYGFAGIAKYEVTDWLSFALRAEYFKDDKGVRTGTAQDLKEITFTPQFKVAQSILVRPEYRHDWSNKEAFDSATKKNQDTVALGVMYTW